MCLTPVLVLGCSSSMITTSSSGSFPTFLPPPSRTTSSRNCTMGVVSILEGPGMLRASLPVRRLMSGVLVATAEGMKLGVPATCPSGWGSSGVEDRELPSPSSSLGLFQRLFSHDGVMKSLTESETRAKRDFGFGRSYGLRE